LRIPGTVAYGTSLPATVSGGSAMKKETADGR
jgi:hypothetical protein